jgi:hypothetical protein
MSLAVAMKGKKVSLVCRVFPNEPIEDLDRQEKVLLDECTKKGYVPISILRYIDPRPEYPDGHSELVEFVDGDRIVRDF